MKKKYFLLIMLLLAFASCDPNNDNNNNIWSEEDKAIYNNLLILQDNAGENYVTWLETMDSIEAINKLQQFFLKDPSVISATICSQGINVQYKNGMRGGIFLNTQDSMEGGKMDNKYLSKTSSSFSQMNSEASSKKALIINPHYRERIIFHDWIHENYWDWLGYAGFSQLMDIWGTAATLDQFTQLSGYKLIHIYSHGTAWPEEKNIEQVYVMTGEYANEKSSTKYSEDIKNGNVRIAKSEVMTGILKNTYFISDKFITDHNDFSKDTALFYGGFCYSFLGGWDQIYKKFAKAAYFGFTWTVLSTEHAKWAVSLVDSLCDTSVGVPYNPEKWINGKIPKKSYWDDIAKKTVSIQFAGDATLTFWIRTKALVETNIISNITDKTATSGGNIIADGGSPITARGVCWTERSEPAFPPIITDSHNNDGIGTGAFVSNISDLKPKTYYYVRAFATSNKGTEYGQVEVFSTITNTHSIGESFGGGIVFYIDAKGEHGLIAATTDQSSQAPWGCYNEIINGTSIGIGTGQANTTAIVSGCSEAGTAAKICNDLVLNGFNDWYLPSKDELLEMYKKRALNGMGVFANAYYWSSSQKNEDAKPFAWVLSPSTVSTYWQDKDYKYYVRAIRSF